MPAPIVAAVVGGGLKKAAGWLGRKLFGKAGKKAIKQRVKQAVELVGGAAKDTAIGIAGYKLGQQSPRGESFGPSGGTSVEPYNPGGYAGGGSQSYAVCNIKGHHMNKSDYFLKSGEFVERGTKCVRNRRMNPLNGRAATKAIARIKGARKMLNRIERSLPKRKASCGGRCSTRRK